MTIDEYWARIRAIPIIVERDTGDGDAVLGRTKSGGFARIEKPDRHNDQRRRELIELYESFYGTTLQ